MNIILRDGYIKRFDSYLQNGLIKFFVGQRRVGKSYLLLSLMDHIRHRTHDANIIYINKEDISFEHVKNHSDLNSYVVSKYNPSKTNFLFIDEIQEIIEYEVALRSLLLQGNIDIYCSGSNANILSGELATLLAGRYLKIRVFSLTYTEFLLFHQLPETDESLLKYIQKGGMPHLIRLQPEEPIYLEYLRNVFDSIVLRDIVARFKIRNVNFLYDLIRFIADNTGSLISAKRISDYLKSQSIAMQPKQVLEYISHLESVFFIERVKRADVVGRKIFEIGEKFYFEDIGMRHSLKPYQQGDINKVLENLVYHHLRVAGFSVYIGRLADKEIDFIAEKDGNRHYIQVAYIISDEKTHDREFGNLLLIPDNYPKMVVSMDPLAGGKVKGVEHHHIRQFLTTFGL